MSNWLSGRMVCLIIISYFVLCTAVRFVFFERYSVNNITMYPSTTSIYVGCDFAMGRWQMENIERGDKGAKAVFSALYCIGYPWLFLEKSIYSRNYTKESTVGVRVFGMIQRYVQRPYHHIVFYDINQNVMYVYYEKDGQPECIDDGKR